VTATTYPESPGAVSTAGLFGRVMALVALTVGFATLGVWLGRSLGGPGWFIAWLLSLGCLIGLNVANSRGQTGRGYAVRRDLSFLYRTAFVLLLALIGFGIVLIFVHIPAVYVAYSLAGLAIFGLYTVIDFNRLRRAGTGEAIPLAAGIFLDVFNIFLFFLRLFGRRA
jgi:Inhibitor of apoptosis-promoting Bax1